MKFGIGSDTLFFWRIDDDFNPRSVVEDGSGLRDFTNFKMPILEVAKTRRVHTHSIYWRKSQMVSNCVTEHFKPEPQQVKIASKGVLAGRQTLTP